MADGFHCAGLAGSGGDSGLAGLADLARMADLDGSSHVAGFKGLDFNSVSTRGTAATLGLHVVAFGAGFGFDVPITPFDVEMSL